MGTVVVYGSEKPITRRTRILIAAGLWLIIGVPVFVALWFWLGWWVLLGVALAIWATMDYIKIGGTGDVVDRFRYPF